MSILREWERRMEATERLERWRVVRDCPHGPLTRRESVVLRLIVFVLAALALMFAYRASAFG